MAQLGDEKQAFFGMLGDLDIEASVVCEYAPRRWSAIHYFKDTGASELCEGLRSYSMLGSKDQDRDDTSASDSRAPDRVLVALGGRRREFGRIGW